MLVPLLLKLQYLLVLFYFFNRMYKYSLYLSKGFFVVGTIRFRPDLAVHAVKLTKVTDNYCILFLPLVISQRTRKALNREEFMNNTLPLSVTKALESRDTIAEKKCYVQRPFKVSTTRVGFFWFCFVFVILEDAS